MTEVHVACFHLHAGLRRERRHERRRQRWRQCRVSCWRCCGRDGRRFGGRDRWWICLSGPRRSGRLRCCFGITQSTTLVCGVREAWFSLPPRHARVAFLEQIAVRCRVHPSRRAAEFGQCAASRDSTSLGIAIPLAADRVHGGTCRRRRRTRRRDLGGHTRRQQGRVERGCTRRHERGEHGWNLRRHLRWRSRRCRCTRSRCRDDCWC